MFLETLQFTAAGALLGVITGLIPGIHVNLIAIFAILLAPSLEGLGIAPHAICAMIIAMAVVHSFLDFIPSIFLGAPEGATALSVLPGHRMLLMGRGVEGVRLTAVGSLGALFLASLFAISTVLFDIPIVGYIYGITKPSIHWILILVVAWMILAEEGAGMGWASFLFLLSGLLGVLGLDSNLLTSDVALFPIFTGLFGVSTLLLSLKESTEMPRQIEDAEIRLSKSSTARAIGVGSLAGIVVGFLPGVGSAQATVLSRELSEKSEDSTREFLVSASGVNTAAAIFSLVAIYFIGKPRSGAAIAVQGILGEFTKYDALYLMAVVAISAGLATFLHLAIGRCISAVFSMISYRALILSVIVFVSSLVLFLSGEIGFFLMSVSTTIGMIPPLVGVKRTHAMGVLLFPTIAYFAGIKPLLLGFIGIGV